MGSISIFGKEIPIIAIILLSIPVVAAVAVWVLTQTTTIRLTPYETPTISNDLTLTDFEIGEVREQDLTITNPNLVPLVVSSYPEGFKLYIDGILIAEGYTTDELQDFVYVPGISVNNPDRYGCDNDVCNNMVIPERDEVDGTTTYTFAYHVPTTYEKDGETVSVTGNEIIQIKWQPIVSVWEQEFFNGDEDWVNPWQPDWYS